MSNAVLRSFIAIIAIFFCIPFVLAGIAIIAAVPDMPTRLFIVLFFFIPSVCAAMAIIVHSTAQGYHATENEPIGQPRSKVLLEIKE